MNFSEIVVKIWETNLLLAVISLFSIIITPNQFKKIGVVEVVLFIASFAFFVISSLVYIWIH